MDRDEGDFQNDEWTGYGIHVGPDDQTYKGEWVAGKWEGYGVKTIKHQGGGRWAYTGQWERDHPSGYGIRTLNSQKEEGEWLNGVYQGPHRIVPPPPQHVSWYGKLLDSIKNIF